MEVIQYNTYKISIPGGMTLTLTGVDHELAEKLDSYINPKDIGDLLKFYQVDNILDLVKVQEAHIKKLQEKVAEPSFILKLMERVRIG